MPTLLLVLVIGAVNVFAFAPFGAWPLQILCAAILFRLVMRAPDVRQAALLGWLYSFAATSAGVYWLYISLHDIGGMPAWLTVLAIGLLALGLGLLVGAATGGARRPLLYFVSCGVLPVLLLINHNGLCIPPSKLSSLNCLCFHKHIFDLEENFYLT